MYARNNHNNLSAVPSGLEEALDEGTAPYETIFSRDYTSEELKEDNETFAIALLDTADINGQVALIQAYQVPLTIGDWTVTKLLCAAMMSAQANSMNMSLRQEYTRVFLDSALVDSGVAGKLDGYAGQLGSVLTVVWDKIKKVGGGFVESVQNFFSNLGRTVGTGLRKFGNGIRRIFEIVYNTNPFLEYLLDFVGLTPAVRFIFGELFSELGLALETGESVEWKAVAAGGAKYLKDMALRLQVASNFLPPPWNIVAKIVAVIFKVSSTLISKALKEHMMALYADWQERAQAARVEYEKELFLTVYEAYGLSPPPEPKSQYGSTGVGGSAGVMILFGGLAVVLGLGMMR